MKQRMQGPVSSFQIEGHVILIISAPPRCLIFTGRQTVQVQEARFTTHPPTEQKHHGNTGLSDVSLSDWLSCQKICLSRPGNKLPLTYSKSLQNIPLAQNSHPSRFCSEIFTSHKYVQRPSKHSFYEFYK